MEEILISYIIDLIFKKTIDPIILEKLKIVHIDWKNTIDKILGKTDTWKKACLNEIASEPISCMITRLFPTLSFENYHELDNLRIWRTVYISHRKWMILSKLQVSVEAYSDFPAWSISSEMIMSFASCDKYFAIGTDRRRICVFGFNQTTKLLNTIVFKWFIKDIRFWYPGTGDVFLVIISRYCYIKFFNVSNNLNEVPCINVERPLADVLCTGTINTLFTISNGNLVQYKYNTENGLIQYKTGRLSGYGGKLFLEKKKLTSIKLKEGSLTFDHYQIPTSDENNEILPEKSVAIFRPNINARTVKLDKLDFLTSNVILQKLLAKKNSCLIIDDYLTKWNIHYPFQKFGSENLVTSGVLHGKILILGFKTGHVRIFTVENIEQLKNSELDLYSGIEYIVDNNGPIQWLQVAEAQEKLIIIAITDNKIYTITFISKKSIK